MPPVIMIALAAGVCLQSAEPAPAFHDYLGFQLKPGANSSTVTFNLVRHYDDPKRPLTAWNITQAEFMSIASGWNESTVNPDRENLFHKHGIADCGYFPDTVINHRMIKGGVTCNPVKDLWRLIYNEYPFYSTSAHGSAPSVSAPSGPGPGWARFPSHPSDGQEAMLRAYGIQHHTELIYGDNAFRLLRDMQDDSWLGRYKGA
ncbi:MAG TPA: hypothetical protein VI731_01300 [Bacteroidia bacterium]|nr:hypothetical protein [Bacteroidia bacterium]